jgi:4-amino-4-deoxy-L-arabinose transferase-like glycosyltransferase
MISKSSKKRLDYLFLGLLIFLLVFTRIIGWSHVIYGDEYSWVQDGLEQRYANPRVQHPPIPTWTYNVVFSLFGDSTLSLRAMVSIISLANIGLAFYLAKKYFNLKAAIFAAILLACSPWFFAGSLQIDNDGAFVVLFFLLATTCYLRFFHEKNAKFLVLTGVFIGGGLLCKYSAVLLPLILFIHYLVNKEPHEKFIRHAYITIKKFTLIMLIALVVFSIFPISSALSGNADRFWYSVRYPTENAVSGVNTDLVSMSQFIQLLQSVLWIGPLFIGLFLLYLFSRQDKKNIFFIWTCVVLVFYVVIMTDAYKPIERYLLNIAIPLAIIGGKVLSDIEWSRRKAVFTAVVSAILLAALFLINLLPEEMINFYPKTGFINAVLGFRWSFLLPLQMSSGPEGFYVNFLGIALAFVVSGMVLIALFIMRRHTKDAVVLVMAQKKLKGAKKPEKNPGKNSDPMQKKTAWLLAVFLAIGLAYGVFLLQEFLLGTTNPNINQVTQDVVSYARTHHLAEPIYVFRNRDLGYYLVDTGPYSNITQLDFKDEFNVTTVDRLMKGSSVVVVDFPQINKQSTLWTALKRCRSVYSTDSNGFTMGYVFVCDND